MKRLPGIWAAQIAPIAIALLPASGAAAQQELPRLGVPLEATTASGFSSGGYMAGQFHLAHSDIVQGAGIVAAGPFGCASSATGALFPWWPMAVGHNAYRALNVCMETDAGEPDVEELAERARELAEDGEIDSLENLEDDRAYLYSGRADERVATEVVKTAAQLLIELGVPAQNVALWTGRAGGHAFLTESEGASCETTAAPYIIDCDYDQAGSILAQLLGPLEPKASEPSGNFIVFDQSNFANGVGHGLDNEGVVYVPKDCAEEPGCRIHIVYHGCEQGRPAIGDAFVKKSGFPVWADTNRLVILFPQIRASAINPNGCWDWWGYSGLDYLTQDAPQIEAVREMLNRLAE